MINWTISQTVDLRHPASHNHINHKQPLMLEGDKNAHVWKITVLDGGKPVDLSGYTLMGYMCRADGSTVVVPNGTISGNVCSITFSGACYAVGGEARGIVRLITTTKTLTIATGAFYIKRGTTDDMAIDAGTPMPTYEQLIAEVEAANATAAEAKGEVAVERARITALAKLKDGSTTGDAELLDARTDAGGLTHENVGDAVRHQADFEYIPVSFIENVGWYINNFEKWMNNPDRNFCMSDAIPVSELDGTLYIYNHISNPYVANVAFSTVNSHIATDLVQTHIFSETGWHQVSVPKSAKYMFISRDVDTDGTIYAGQLLARSRREFNETVRAKLLALGDVSDKVQTTISLELPLKYELVVGDTFELFWKGVIHSTRPEDLYVKAKCANGIAYARKFVYTPTATDVGTHTLTVELYSAEHALLDSAAVELDVKSKASSPSTEKVVLYVGDSLTINGYVPHEFCRRLTANDGNPAGDGLRNIAFIGNSASVFSNTPYVGTGGWTFESYNSSMRTGGFMWISCAMHGKDANADQHSVYADVNGTQWRLETIEADRIKLIRASGSTVLPETGSLTWVAGGANKNGIAYTASEQAAGNPLWNEDAGKVDFATFVESQGKHTLDYVYVLLGWNSANDTEDVCKAAVRTFINNVLTSYPNCKIVLLGLQIPSRDGLAVNYGARTYPYSWYDEMLDYVFKLNGWYQDIAEEYSNVSFVNIAGQFDSDNNMQTSEMSVNVRNSATEIVQTNGVHPAVSGYYQIADACYRDFVHKLSEQ